jgi:hypothetical protein
VIQFTETVYRHIFMSRQIRLAWKDPNDRHLLIAALTQLFIVICLFWAALNEEGRMQLAQLGVEAKSIEHGAKLYSNYCAICHGINGLGLAGKAPALNNPQLFGHDFFPDVTHQIDVLYAETKKLTDEKYASNTTDARKNEIDARINEIDKTVTDLDLKRKTEVNSTLDKGYDPSDRSFNRLFEVGWEGTTRTFILTSLIHGRPNSGSYWPMAMPAYSKEAFAGQILERYELDDLTAYIMNWDKGEDWTLDDLFAVNQFAIKPIDPAWLRIWSEPPRKPLPPPVGTDIKAITNELKNTVGDPMRGEQLYNAKVNTTLTGMLLPCTGCHQQSANAVGPMTDGTYTRVINERLKQPQFAGYMPEEYLIESIVLPQHYIVPEFQDLMPRNFGTEIMYIQDLADIVAYLMTQK